MEAEVFSVDLFAFERRALQKSVFGLVFLLAVKHPNNDNSLRALNRSEEQANNKEYNTESGKVNFIHKTSEFLSFETNSLHSHTNLYKSNLCNTTPLIKQGSRPCYLIVSSLGRLCASLRTS